MSKSKKSNTDVQVRTDKTETDQIQHITPPKFISNDQTVNWNGVLNAQGLPVLPTPNFPTQGVDMNMIVTLAQMMTANVLSALRQNSFQSLPEPYDEKKERKANMKILQQRLIHRKNNPPASSSIKKKKKKPIKPPQQKVLENPNTSALELLAYTTVAEQNIMDSVKGAQDSKRGSLSHIFNSPKSPGLLTALQSKFPNIDWNTMDQIASDHITSDQIQSLVTDSGQNNVSESAHKRDI